MSTRHFIDASDYTTAEIKGLIDEGIAMKANPREYTSVLQGKALALLFEKPSLRTRVSFDVGIHQLGGFSIYLSPNDINLGKRESIPDVARNLDRMVQGVMVRTFSHQVILDMAEYSRVPIINGLTDFSHPCQAVADFMTMREYKGRVDGLKLAYVGDGNNLAHSLMHTGVRLGSEVRIVTPKGYEPDTSVVEWAQRESPATGAKVWITNDPAEGVKDADVVYTDVWASMGQESEAEERRKIFIPFQVNSDLMAHAADDAIFMHCLPAHRGEEVTDEVIDSRQSVVFDQAENRLHSQKAVMALLMK